MHRTESRPVAAILDGDLCTDGDIRSQSSPDRLDDLGTRGRDDDDVSAGPSVFVDEFHGLLVDHGIDDLVKGFVDDALDLLDFPTGDEGGHVVAHAFHLIVISARCEKDELRVGASDDIGSSDQPFAVEGSGESERTRLREDGLIEVKESCLRHLATVALDEFLAVLC